MKYKEKLTELQKKYDNLINGIKIIDSLLDKANESKTNEGYALPDEFYKACEIITKILKENERLPSTS